MSLINGAKLLAILVLVSLSSAQDYSWNKTSSATWGARVDGDEFLFIAIRTSPFFTEPSTFEADFEYDGRGRIHNLTMYRIVNQGTGNFVSSGTIDSQVVKLKIKLESIYHAQSVMKLYGFKNP